MKLKMYSIYDSIAQAFMKPMYFHNDGEALRIFEQAVNDENKENMIYKHPEQFTLFSIGEWDDKVAMVEQKTQEHKPIGIGIEYKKEEKTTDLEEIKKLIQELGNVTHLKKQAS